MASVSALAPALAMLAVEKGLVSAARTNPLLAIPKPVGVLCVAQACQINYAAAGSYSMDKSLTACFFAGPLLGDKTDMRTDMWSILS